MTLYIEVMFSKALKYKMICFCLGVKRSNGVFHLCQYSFTTIEDKFGGLELF